MKIAIVGAGIMGRLLAFLFHQSGYAVSLFGPDEQNSCSMAAAGLLTPITELAKNDALIFQLGLDSLKKYWPNILAQLPAVYFRQLGSLVLAHANDMAELRHLIQLIVNKLDNAEYLQQLSPEQLQSLEPAITKFQTAYHFTLEGQIDNQALMLVMADYLHKSIVWIKSFAQIQTRKIIVESKTYNFDLICDCRGLSGKSSFNDLRAVRGELIWLHAQAVNIKRPLRIMHPRYPLYIVPRANNIYLLGASEIESVDDSALSVRTALELLTAAYSVYAGFAEARIIKTVTQLRPTLIDNLPKIKYAPHFIAINGLYRHGFLIAPTLAIDVLNWVQKGFVSIRYPQLWEQWT